MENNHTDEFDFSSRKIYKSISNESRNHQLDVNGNIKAYYDNIDISSLNPIEYFIRKVTRTKESGYLRQEKSLRDGAVAINFKDTKLSIHFRAIKSYILTIHHYEAIYIFSEYVTIFQESCRELKLSADLFNKPGFYVDQVKKYEADLFNDLIESIRVKAKSKEFKKRVSNRDTNASRMLNSINGYVDELFRRHSRLLVIRLDLSYRNINASTGLPQNHTSLQQVKSDFRRFKNNMRHNKLFQHLKGDIWKLEYGEFKGLHYHLILFFQGSEVKKDAYYGAQIGEYWQQSITKNRGAFHNCNAEKKKYAELGILGIGMIDVGTEGGRELRSNLQNGIIRYLAKKEQHLKAKLTCKEKVMGKGQVSERTSNAGRPRKVTEANHADD